METYNTKKVSLETFFNFFNFVSNSTLYFLLVNQSLSLLFDPVSPDLWFGYEHFSYINQRIRIFSGTFPDLEKVDIAIIGLIEERGNPDNEGSHSGADAIRQAFYSLRASHVKYNIADLGNLRPGETLEDSYLRLKEVVRILLENGTIPLIIGGTHDHTLPVVWAYEELARKLTLVNVDSKSDTEPSAQAGMSNHHISRILTRHKESISRYIHIAYQTYLMDENILAAIDQHHHFKMRLGEIREDFKSVEPLIRSADFYSFDISSIRMSEAPANGKAFPFGLTGEEACQMAWYAGCSSKLTSFGLFEMNPSLDYRDTTAQMLGTMIWYFVEGFYNRVDDLSFSPAVTTKYQVQIIGSKSAEITFFKSITSGKWWIEVSGPTGNEKIPCSAEDYQHCIKGEIPSRWLDNCINIS